MKTTLIAAACMCMIGSVQAQSNVTVYGVVDQYVDFSKVGPYSANRIQSGGLDGSRLGFKGVEALGGGLKAVFQLEAGFNADTGTSGQGALFGRQSYVGLGGDFGLVTLGRQNSSYFDTMGAYGLGGGLAWGNATEYFNVESMPMLRINNSIKYESPDFGGFVFKALYGAKEKNVSDEDTTGNIGSVGGQYSRGPFSMGLSYTTRQTQPSNLERWTAFGTSYNFGPIKPAFLMTDARDDIGMVRNNTFEISAEIPLTNSSLLLDVGYFRDRAFANANATSYSLRYDYFLSKRTTLYTGVAYIKAQPNAEFGINGATGEGLIGRPGDNSRSFIAGIRHAF